MAGNDDDKGKDPAPKPSTEEAGAGDASGENPGKIPPTPEGQDKRRTAATSHNPKRIFQNLLVSLLAIMPCASFVIHIKLLVFLMFTPQACLISTRGVMVRNRVELRAGRTPQA